MMATLSFQSVILDVYSYYREYKIVTFNKSIDGKLFQMDMQWIYVIRMIVPIQPFLCLYALEVEGRGGEVFVTQKHVLSK